MRDLHLSKTEQSILRYADEHDRFTLADLTARFRRTVAVPRRWTYATAVPVEQRPAWLASLRARNGIRRLVRVRLIAKITPGHYEITSLGRAIAPRKS